MQTLPLPCGSGRLILLAFVAVLKSLAGEWPAFRGTHGDGVAAGEKVPIQFGPDKNLVWKVATISGLSSPVVWKDTLFLTGSEGKNLKTIAIDRLTGKPLWEQSVIVEKLEPVHKANSHATSTPVTDGKSLFVYFGSFGLLAYDLAGKELWRKPLPIPKTFFNQGTGTSPVLADGKLLIFVQQGSDSHILAVKPQDGGEIWKAAMPDYNNSYSTPVVWQEGGQGMVGLACATRFTAFGLADGKERWWVNDIGYQACSTPVVMGDRLIIAAAGVQGDSTNITPPPTFEDIIKTYDKNADGLIAVEEIPADLLYTDRHAAQGKGNMSVRQAFSMFGGVKKEDKMDRDKYSQIREGLVGFRTGKMNQTVALCARTGGKGDVTESLVDWRVTKGVPEVPSPLVWENRVYMIRSGGLLVCLDAKTGKLIYENRIDSPGGYFASPVVAGGHIYLSSDRGTVTVIKAGDNFEVLARNELDDLISASPVVAANTLYVRSASKLWAFAEKSN